MACEANRYDELKDCFRAYRWDAISRLELVLIENFGIEDNPRTRTLTRIMFMQGVIRALYPGPGCKADVMVVLQGKEGLRKSSFLCDLCPNPTMYGADIPHPLGSKDSKEYLEKKFIIEIAEMHSYRKSEVEAQKQFLSIEADTFRASYGHFTEIHWRRMIFTGTSNLEEIIAENGRRIGILACKKRCNIETKDIPLWREQIWAEAIVMYQTEYVDKGRMIVTSEEEEMFKAGNEQYVIRSGYDDKFEIWKTIVGPQWFTLDDVWEFIAKGRDTVDLEREKKRLTDALRNAGCENMTKRFKTKSEHQFKGPMDPEERRKLEVHLTPPKAVGRLWRVKKYKEEATDLSGPVDHILDVYNGKEWLQKSINGSDPDMQPDERANRAGI